MSEEPPGSIFGPEYWSIRRNNQRLRGCMALRVDPDFDLAYFDSITTEWHTTDMNMDKYDEMIYEKPDLLMSDLSVEIETVSRITGLTRVFTHKMIFGMPHHFGEVDKYRSVKLSGVERYLKACIDDRSL